VSFRIAGIGELLWDRFPDGDRLGGAPANFAFHAGQLGAQSRIISRVGQDPDGDRLIESLLSQGLATDLIQRDESHPTGTVRVSLKEGQPSYTIESPVAWDFIELTDPMKALAVTLDAVFFGTLAQRNPSSEKTIQNFIRLCPREGVRLFDINLRQSFYTRESIEFGLSQATVLKLNGEELQKIAILFDWPRQEAETLTRLFKHFPLNYIAVTLGADGCEIYSREEKVRSLAPKVACVDAVGAGDAFSAALVVGLLRKQSLQSVADQANCVGAFVASQRGAMPLLPSEITTS
jgi:fructokinase